MEDSGCRLPRVLEESVQSGPIDRPQQFCCSCWWYQSQPRAGGEAVRGCGGQKKAKTWRGRAEKGLWLNSSFEVGINGRKLGSASEPRHPHCAMSRGEDTELWNATPCTFSKSRLRELCGRPLLRFVSFHPSIYRPVPDNANLVSLPTTSWKFRRRARRNRMATLLFLLALALLLVLPAYIVYKPPAFVINHFARKWPDVLWQVQTKDKIIGLTIDDAPSQHTPEILKILKENDAHATFFLIGSQMNGHEDNMGDIIKAGSELGNHAMHDEASRSLPVGQLEAEILEVRRKIKNLYDYEDVPMPANYFRPGSGFFSDRMRRLIDKLGYRMVLGSVYPHDAQISNWKLNAKHILSMARPGAIIICHDRRSWTIPMLRKVLPELKRRGYRIMNLSELLKEVDTDR
ncbi:Uncharacterized protein CGGC5_v013687 [Colletotrichum fructicola Nara gc5]|uniref:chitin deacetylase n=2 Tax=Colletotrichum fructicola (strain Nara gc5) TaxID=1213859 RepID=A0A7J6INT9_COLFN|nr:Uncharacterized protein CGGC5_v013687 [Colletotrichum fructicola Nara gc5]